MSTCVTAVEHLRKLRGGSQAHLLVGSDGRCYVTKFANNPQHIRVLANEMFAGSLPTGWGCQWQPRRSSMSLDGLSGSRPNCLSKLDAGLFLAARASSSRHDMSAIQQAALCMTICPSGVRTSHQSWRLCTRSCPGQVGRQL